MTSEVSSEDRPRAVCGRSCILQLMQCFCLKVPITTRWLTCVDTQTSALSRLPNSMTITNSNTPNRRTRFRILALQERAGFTPTKILYCLYVDTSEVQGVSARKDTKECIRPQRSTTTGTDRLSRIVTMCFESMQKARRTPCSSSREVCEMSRWQIA